ncbi:MAG: Trk system potassium transporter TrkA [Acidobacteriota bacterium]
MEPKRYVVMGAGEVGFHLARTLSQEGHHVTVIERDAGHAERIEDQLDALVVVGNGSQVRVLEKAQAEDCDLFLAVSSNDEANLAASLLAKRLGAQRCVVRMGTGSEVVRRRKVYEDAFGADLLLSTQLLTTSRIVNRYRGFDTTAVEYFAAGQVQLRKVALDAASALVEQPLRDVSLPADSLVVAFFRGDELIIPSGDDRAEEGDEALILAGTDSIAQVERMVTAKPAPMGSVVIAGGSRTGQLVAESLAGLGAKITLIERDRRRAQVLAADFPWLHVLHGEATDLALLKAERVESAHFFVAVTGNDESNLMASLLAQELGVPNVLALVDRAETSHLWRRLGLMQVFSPRSLAYERIHEYIDSGYSANIVSLQRGAAQVIERRLHPASPAAGVTLAEMKPPRGVIVGAVVRGRKVFVPRGKDRLEAGDLVILFVREEELPTVRLLFPGIDRPQ